MALDASIQQLIHQGARDSLVDTTKNLNYLADLDDRGRLSELLGERLDTMYAWIENPTTITPSWTPLEDGQDPITDQQLDYVLNNSFLSLILADEHRIDNWAHIQRFVENHGTRIPLLNAKAESMERPYQNRFTRFAAQQLEAKMANGAIKAARRYEDARRKQEGFQPVVEAFLALDEPTQHAIDSQGRDGYCAFVKQQYDLDANPDAKKSNFSAALFSDDQRFKLAGIEPDTQKLNAAFRELNIGRRAYTAQAKSSNRVRASAEAFPKQIDAALSKAAHHAVLAGVLAYMRQEFGDFDALDKPYSNKEFESELAQAGFSLYRQNQRYKRTAR